LRLVQRSGESLLRDSQGGPEGGRRPADAGGAGDEGGGDSDDPGLLAAGAGAQRAQLRDLARAAAAGVASGGDSDSGGSQPFPARAVHGGVQPALCGAGRGGGDGVRTGAPGGPGSGFLPPARARGESRQHRAARSAGVADREDAVARNAGGMPGDPVRALGWTTDHSLRSAPGGSFFSRGVAGAEARRAIQDQTGGNLRGGGTAVFGANLSRPTGSFGQRRRKSETGQIVCYKKRTF